MKIINYRIFEGRNVYSHRKCIRVDLDLQGYSEIPTKDIRGLNEKLVSSLPELKLHRCGIYEEGGFVTRLGEGTYLAHVCEHTTIALHERLGLDVSYGKARAIEGERYYIIFQYKYKQTGLALVKLAVDYLNSLISQKDFNLQQRLDSVKIILEKESIGPSTEAILNAAKSRGIPFVELFDSGIFQIG